MNRRARRRARFATPFVVVLGCGQPYKPVEEPADEEKEEEDVAAPIYDARVDDSFDPIVLGPVRTEAEDVPCGPRKFCNPPPPQRIDARVVKLEVVSNGTVIILDKGSDDGVERGWRGHLVSAAGKPVRGGELVVIKVLGSRAVALVKLAGAAVERASMDVVLEPPP